MQEEGAGVQEPLLPSRNGRGRMLERPRTILSLVLPCLAGVAVYCAESVFFYQKVAAGALCCYSMVEPSVVSAGLMLALSKNPESCDPREVPLYRCLGV